MAGIYIHIPFCKQACYYCDFHFSTNLILKTKMVDALLDEISTRKDFFTKKTPLETIYFGGGTPSILEASEIEKLLAAIYRLFPITPGAEITLEANPDDLRAPKLQDLKNAGINRLSIGIQTFNDSLLKSLNRVHTAAEAKKAYNLARRAGFDNINCDLIYAIPGESVQTLRNDLRSLVSLAPEHISAYCLTIEDKTIFGVWRDKGKLTPVDEDHAADHFEITAGYLSSEGYEGYEVSNFCRPGFESKHNCSYWKDEPYLGIGPGAHSYNGQRRGYNVKNNNLYINAINEGQTPFTHENLSFDDQVNEYLLTSLRTKWGCDLDYLKSKYQLDLQRAKEPEISYLAAENLILLKQSVITVSPEGKLLTDYIASRLFIDGE